MGSVVELTGVSLKLNLSSERVLSLKEYFVRLLKRQLHYEEFRVLKDLSLSIEKGEIFGIVGHNGAGKSTLLKLIAGIYKPSSGSIKVIGSVAPLIELGAGFDFDFTARENVFLNGSMLGMRKADIIRHYDEIIDFAELKEFEYVPLRCFSSGMVARLGFSIATAIRPDILIADEILGVGDYRFQKKCASRIKAMVKTGTTLLLVSHSLDMVSSMCDRALWLENGAVVKIGGAANICREYAHETARHLPILPS